MELVQVSILCPPPPALPLTILCRYEYQSRGAAHAHGTCKLEDDPGLIDLVLKAYRGRCAEKQLEDPDCWLQQSDVEDLREEAEEGQAATDQVVAYVDSLVTTCLEHPRPSLDRLSVQHRRSHTLRPLTSRRSNGTGKP